MNGNHQEEMIEMMVPETKAEKAARKKPLFVPGKRCVPCVPTFGTVKC